MTDSFYQQMVSKIFLCCLEAFVALSEAGKIRKLEDMLGFSVSIFPWLAIQLTKERHHADAQQMVEVRYTYCPQMAPLQAQFLRTETKLARNVILVFRELMEAASTKPNNIA